MMSRHTLFAMLVALMALAMCLSATAAPIEEKAGLQARDDAPTDPAPAAPAPAEPAATPLTPLQEYQQEQTWYLQNQTEIAQETDPVKQAEMQQKNDQAYIDAGVKYNSELAAQQSSAAAPQPTP